MQQADQRKGHYPQREWGCLQVFSQGRAMGGANVETFLSVAQRQTL